LYYSSTTIPRLKDLLSARMPCGKNSMLRWRSCWRDLRQLSLAACRDRACLRPWRLRLFPLQPVEPDHEGAGWSAAGHRCSRALPRQWPCCDGSVAAGGCPSRRSDRIAATLGEPRHAGPRLIDRGSVAPEQAQVDQSGRSRNGKHVRTDCSSPPPTPRQVEEVVPAPWNDVRH
jgi:hypothetical protein